MPEFVGLGRRAFAVAISYDDEGGRFDLRDEVDGGALGVNDGVVVDRSAEIGNHPLVDFVLAVVTEVVGNTGASHGRSKAVGLGDSPHGQEAAIAPAGES